MRIRSLLAALLAVLGLHATPAVAGPYSAITAFGDSLIDTGSGPMPLRPPAPPPPYVGGRFTNGPTPTEHLRDGLGIPLNSYAVGGAFSGFGNVDVLPAVDCSTQAPHAYCTGVLSQVNQYLFDTGGTAQASELYIVMGGSNDFLGLLAATGGAPDPLDVANTALDVISNLNTAIATLYGAGARNFLLPLLPDIGAAPLVQDPLVSATVADINLLLLQSYQDLFTLLGDPDLKFTLFDTYEAQRNLMPGFANSTEACFDALAGTLCTNPDDFFFWDDLHQTAKVSELLGVQLLNLVPEPPTVALLALALLAVGARRARVTGQA